MICLLPNCCFLSETSRMLEIYEALRARGAEVRVATHGGPYTRVLTDAGVSYELIGEGMDAERSASFVRSVPGIGSPDQSMWDDEEMRGYVEAEAACFRAHDVRAVVTGWTLTALLSTRVAGIPLVTEHAGSYLPPVFERGLLPAPSRPVGLPFERLLPRPVRRWMVNKGAARLALYTDDFNRLAGELGVEGIPSFPALLLGDLTLVTDVPEVLGVSRHDVDTWTPRDPSRYRNGTRLRYTGPLYARLALPVPDRVERFLTGPGPVVYVSVNSSPAELVRRIVGALTALDVRILMAATVHDLGDLESEQVMVEALLPNHLVMPRVDLAVTAGGQGSVQTALASGVPLIGVPLQPEQDANVAFAERAGAARLVSMADAGTPRMTELARAMLDGEGHRQAARRLQAVFAAVDGAGAAAEAILELVGAPGAHAGRFV
ncbi:glycosyltransferase [Actinomadura scrupuli]|uniref:glycosyltransferase n=1 Tax=Actinomadura scrupuli TaxID=559629 RepID=UPI003D9687A3